MTLADLLPSVPVFSAYVVAVVALTLTPGPDMTLFLGKTLTQGRMAGVAAFSGAAFGLLVHTLLVAVGLSAILAASATAFLALKVVGAGYLLWLAWDALRNGSSFAPAAAEIAPEPRSKVFLKGVMINLLNPKIVVFFITFLPQFVVSTDPAAGIKLGVLGVLFVVIAAPISVALIYSAGGIASSLRRNPKLLRAVDWLFATVMVSFAVKLVLARAD